MCTRMRVSRLVHALHHHPSLTFSVEAPAYLIDLMHDKNAEIRKVCDNTLDIIAVSEPLRRPQGTT